MPLECILDSAHADPTAFESGLLLQCGPSCKVPGFRAVVWVVYTLFCNHLHRVQQAPTSSYICIPTLASLSPACGGMQSLTIRTSWYCWLLFCDALAPCHLASALVVCACRASIWEVEMSYTLGDARVKIYSESGEPPEHVTQAAVTGIVKTYSEQISLYKRRIEDLDLSDPGMALTRRIVSRMEGRPIAECDCSGDKYAVCLWGNKVTALAALPFSATPCAEHTLVWVFCHPDVDCYCDDAVVSAITSAVVDKYTGGLRPKVVVSLPATVTPEVQRVMEQAGFVKLLMMPGSRRNGAWSQHWLRLLTGNSVVDIAAERLAYAKDVHHIDHLEGFLLQHKGAVDWVAPCALPGCKVYTRRLCGGCGKVAFCCKEHLHQKWKAHKPQCKAWQKTDNQMAKPIIV